MNENNKVLKAAILSISSILISGTAINAAIPQMRDSLEITQAQSELLSTVPSISVMIFVLLSNVIANKIGMKKTVVMGIIFAGIGGIIPTVANEYHQILASRILFGAGIGLFNTFAVSYINILYSGNTKASLLGMRASMEGLGQATSTVVAGLLLNIGWHFSFSVYALAFPIAIFFYLIVPDVNHSNNAGQEELDREKMNPLVYLLVLFAVVIVMCGAAVAVRFPSIATEIHGEGYNAAMILAVKPLLGITAGLLFGTANKLLGRKVLYIGVLMFALSSLLVGFSNGNFTILLFGFFLGGFPPAWIFPFIFNTVSEITTGKNLNFATSLIFVGANIGVFIMPFAIQLLTIITGNETLEAPFPIFGTVLLIILAVLIISDVKGKKVAIETVSVN